MKTTVQTMGTRHEHLAQPFMVLLAFLLGFTPLPSPRSQALGQCHRKLVLTYNPALALPESPVIQQEKQTTHIHLGTQTDR